MNSPASILYVTSSDFKIAEIEHFEKHCEFLDGRRVGDHFRFNIQRVQIPELLEVDIELLVRAEATSAYSQLRVPCIVEHAGLIFEDFAGTSYPGGLTKPMWNTLGEKFLKETNSGGRLAIARAVVGFCDGMRVKTFTGETRGMLSEVPRGSRSFYWDTVFVPNNDDGTPGSQTYAEIVADPTKGLPFKVERLSQSMKAMREFLRYLHSGPLPHLWASN